MLGALQEGVMSKMLCQSMVTVAVMLSTAVAYANPGGVPNHSAPEPVTIIGLALGAAGIAAARWASGRRSSRKQ
jgi:hypothetical protein